MKAVALIAMTSLGTLAVGMLTSCGGSQEQAASGQQLQFNRDIRPILSQNCFRCHGPDAETRKAGLRLDLPGPAYAQVPNKPGHHAIVPGKPGKSEMVARITSTDPDYRMPHQLAPLSAAQVQTLVTWIRQGAPFEKQWSLAAPKDFNPPHSKYDTQVVNAIDQFVFAGLAEAKLAPAKEADRATLIRRVSLTLTGLPPTLSQVDAFLNDKSPNAYEKVVDRLLASPAYGENMAAAWMDLARWADTDGYLDDHHDRLLWPWRDWVISAFNANMPYNQFGSVQLDGDQLPGATKDQILATAFLRLGQRTTENGALNEQFRINQVVDKVNTVGTTYLGLTVGCAECHDHKYDPISQKDYYSFSGFFNNADEQGVVTPGFLGQSGPTLAWPSQQQQQQLDQANAALLKTLSDYVQSLSAASKAAAPQVTAMVPGAAGTPHAVKTAFTSSEHTPPVRVAGLVRESLDRAMVAYYPFDSVQPIAKKDYPLLKRPPIPLPPASLGATLKPPAFFRQGRGANPRLPPTPAPPGYKLDQMKFSPAGMPGVVPAVLQDAHLGPGIRGQAMYYTGENRGYFVRNVGDFERTQPFSFDFWFYPAQSYKTEVPIFEHGQGKTADTWETGTSGYQLVLNQQHLVFYMSHLRPHNMIGVSTTETLPLKQWAHIALTYDGSSKAAGLHIYINGKPADLQVFRDNLTRSIDPWSAPVATAVGFDPFAGLSFGARFRERAPENSALDEFRIFNRDLTALEVDYLNAGDRAFSDANASTRSSLVQLLAIRDPRVQATRRALDEARAQEDQVISGIPEVLVAGDSPVAKPAHLLWRGKYDEPREEVPTQGLEQIFPWDPRLPRNRVGLARWLFDPRNPLPARVEVNRIWEMNFGVGLVKTAQDFGSQGSTPTHPELLDWLATDFVQHGWDVKRLQKMIVMSATFRQDSKASEALLTRDPENTLLARGPRFRMTGRMIRDSVLQESALLVQTIGGASTYPYQPDDIWSPQITFYRYPDTAQEPPSELYRRTMYTFVKRNALNPQLQLLDAADPTVSIARLTVSNTPMQSLLLLNSPQYVEAYRVLAQSTLESQVSKAANDASVLKEAFRRVRQQYPSDAQLQILRDFYRQRMQHYQGNDTSALALEKVGVAPVDKSLDAKQVAALTDVVSMIFNTPDSYFVQ